MADEVIAGVSISVTADLSQLRPDFDQAVSMAQAAGANLAEAIQSASAPASAAFAAIGTAAQAASEGFSKFAEAASSVPYSEMSGQIGILADSLGTFGAQAQAAGTGAEQAAVGVKSLGDAENQAEPATQSLGDALKNLSQQFLAIGEAVAFTEGLRELGVAALEAYGDLQKSEMALTAMTGSAANAVITINELKALSLSDALSFDQLVVADQRMTAFGFAAGEIKPALEAAANGAAEMNRSFESVANAMDRVADSGNISSRTLTTLGLNFDDIAKEMGMVGSSTKELTAIFKEFTPDQRLQTITEAMNKFGDVAQTVAKGVAGQWKDLGTNITFALQGVGEALAPVATQLLAFLNSEVLPKIQEWIKEFNDLPTPIKDVAVAVGLLAAAIPPLIIALASVGFALIGLEEVGPALVGIFQGLTTAVGTSAIATEGLALAEGEAGVAATGAATSVGVFESAVTALKATVAALAVPFAIVATAIAEWNLPRLSDDTKDTTFGINQLVQAVIDGIAPFSSLKQAIKDLSEAFKVLSPSMDLPKQGLTDLNAKLKESQMAAADAALGFKVFTVSGSAALDNLKTSIADVAAGLRAQAAAAAEAKAAQAELNQEWTTANGLAKSASLDFSKIPIDFAAYTASLTQGGATVDAQIAKITNDIARLQDASENLKGAPLENVKGWISTLQQGLADLNAFKDDAAKLIPDSGLTSIQKANDLLSAQADIFGNLLAKTTSDEEKLHQALDTYNAIAQSVDKAGAGQRDYNAALKLVQDAQEQVNKDIKAQGDIMSENAPLVALNSEAVKEYQKNTTAMLAALIPVPDALNKVQHAMKDLGLTLDETGVAQTKLEKGFDELAQTGTTNLELIDAAWSKISGTVNHLNTTDLPEAIKLEQEHVNLLVNANAAIGQQVQAVDQLLQSQINYANQQGQDADSLIIKLTNIDLLQKANVMSANLLGDSYALLAKDFLAIPGQLASAFTDAITGAKTWHDALSGFIDDLGKKILNDLIGKYLQALEGELIKIIAGDSGLGALLKSVTSTSTSAADALKGAGDGMQKAADSIKESVDSINKNLSQAAKGAQQAATSALTSVSQITGIVTGIITAVASIIGVFQQAHMESDLTKIEASTRFLWIKFDQMSTAVFWPMFENTGYMVTDLDEIGNMLGGLYDVARQQLADLDAIVAAVAGYNMPHDSVSNASMSDSLNALSMSVSNAMERAGVGTGAATGGGSVASNAGANAGGGRVDTIPTNTTPIIGGGDSGISALPDGQLPTISGTGTAQTPTNTTPGQISQGTISGTGITQLPTLPSTPITISNPTGSFGPANDLGSLSEVSAPTFATVPSGSGSDVASVNNLTVNAPITINGNNMSGRQIAQAVSDHLKLTSASFMVKSA